MGQEKKKTSGFVKSVTNKVRKNASPSPLRSPVSDTMDVSRQRNSYNSLPDLKLDISSGSSTKFASKKSSSSSALKKLVKKGKKKEKKDKKKEKKDKKKNKNKKEVVSLYAALDMVTPKYVLQRLDQIWQDDSIVLLNVEDLIISGNEQSEELLVQLSNFFFAGDRKWESINFADNVRPGAFKGWLRSVRETMDFFEEVFRQHSGSLGFETLTFQAKLEFEEDSRLSNLVGLLRNIKRQRRVAAVKFLIDTFEMDEEALAELIGDNDGILGENVMLVITFGWMPDPTGLLLMEAVLRLARNAGMNASETFGMRRAGTDPSLLDLQFGDESSGDEVDLFGKKASTKAGVSKPQTVKRSNTFTGPSRSSVKKNASWFDDDDVSVRSGMGESSRRLRLRDKRPSAARLPRNTARIPNVDTESGRVRRQTLTETPKKTIKLSEAAKNKLRLSLSKQSNKLANPYGTRDAGRDSDGASCSSLGSDDSEGDHSLEDSGDDLPASKQSITSKNASTGSRRGRRTVRALSPQPPKLGGRLKNSSSAPNLLDSPEKADALKSFQQRRRSKEALSALRRSASSSGVPGTSRSAHYRSLNMKNAQFPTNRISKSGRSKSTDENNLGTKNAVFGTAGKSAPRSSKKSEISIAVQDMFSSKVTAKPTSDQMSEPIRMSTWQSQNLLSTTVKTQVSESIQDLSATRSSKKSEISVGLQDMFSSKLAKPTSDQIAEPIRTRSVQDLFKESSSSTDAGPNDKKGENEVKDTLSDEPLSDRLNQTPDLANETGAAPSSQPFLREGNSSQAFLREGNSSIASIALCRRDNDCDPAEGQSISSFGEGSTVWGNSSGLAKPSSEGNAVQRRGSFRVQRALSGSRKQKMGDLLGKLNAVSLDISGHSSQSTQKVS